MDVVTAVPAGLIISLNAMDLMNIEFHRQSDHGEVLTILIPFVRCHSSASKCLNFAHVLPRSFSSTVVYIPMFSGGCFNHSAKIIIRRQNRVCVVQTRSVDTRVEREKELKRLQIRLRLRPERSTPTDSNSGLDSDSAALLGTARQWVAQQSDQPEE